MWSRLCFHAGQLETMFSRLCSFSGVPFCLASSKQHVNFCCDFVIRFCVSSVMWFDFVICLRLLVVFWELCDCVQCLQMCLRLLATRMRVLAICLRQICDMWYMCVLVLQLLPVFSDLSARFLFFCILSAMCEWTERTIIKDYLNNLYYRSHNRLPK